MNSSWAGALTEEGLTVAAKLSQERSDVRLRVDGTGGPFFSALTPTVARTAKLTVTGLAADTAYTYQVEAGGVLVGDVVSFTTLPAASGDPASFRFAFASCALSGSNEPVFDSILAEDPLFFAHTGDMHYGDFAVNSSKLFHDAFDEVFEQPRQSALYRRPTVYVPDDHDYGPNNSDSTSATKPACTSVYRVRVPHYPLPDATGMWQTFDVGRVRFIVTDQRSGASPDGNTDNASKSMLGTTQKTWFKNLLSNSPGMLIVWVCPRMFGVAPGAGDHWGSFSTERTEIGAHANANCPGRVLVLSGDQHGAGFDDGTNHTFGGEAFRTFQAAPLDQFTAGPAAPDYTGGWFDDNGQYGTMQVDDAGGASIDVTWEVHDSTGAVLATTTFSVAV